MNRVMLVIIFLFTFTGCTKKQDLTQKSSPVVPVQEAKVEETEIQVVSSVNPVKVTKETTAVNGWGFSIFDPKTEVTRYYTNNGVFLEQKQVD